MREDLAQRPPEKRGPLNGPVATLFNYVDLMATVVEQMPLELYKMLEKERRAEEDTTR